MKLLDRIFKTCFHKWVYDNPHRRTCKKCKAHEVEFTEAVYNRLLDRVVSVDVWERMNTFILVALIAISAASCSRYTCYPSKGSKDYSKAQVIGVIQRNINQTFKTAICWDNGGVYDTVTLSYFAKAGTCLTKCETLKP